MNLSKKNRILTSTLAVALVAVIIAGVGTFSYLQGTTQEVTNEFNPNEVTIELEETPNDYEIIPGTEQDKDPKVTVHATVDSYVFVEVTDTTDGLVTYAIDSGWTEIPELASGDTKIYYREVTGSDSDQEFDILEGNKVSYASELENEDMYVYDDAGNVTGLKDGLELNFIASAVQKVPFNDPIKAYFRTEGDVVTVPTGLTLAEIKDIINSAPDGATIVLEDGIHEIPAIGLRGSENLTIDLNGNDVFVTNPPVGSAGTESQALHFERNTAITIKNGTLKLYDLNDIPLVDGHRIAISCFAMLYGDITFEDVNIDLNTDYGLYWGITVAANTLTLKGNTNILNGPSTDYGMALDIDDQNAARGYGDVSSIIIIDESMTGTIDGSILLEQDAENPDTVADIVIKGGTFKNLENQAAIDNECVTVTAANLASYVPAGYHVVDNGDGSYTVVAD